MVKLWSGWEGVMVKLWSVCCIAYRASLKLGLDRAVLQSMNSQRDPIAAANGVSYTLS